MIEQLFPMNPLVVLLLVLLVNLLELTNKIELELEAPSSKAPVR